MSARNKPGHGFSERSARSRKISVTLPNEVMNELRLSAATEGVSMGEIIRRAVLTSRAPVSAGKVKAEYPEVTDHKGRPVDHPDYVPGCDISGRCEVSEEDQRSGDRMAMCILCGGERWRDHPHHGNWGTWDGIGPEPGSALQPGDGWQGERDDLIREIMDLREALNPPRSGPDAWCQPMDCGKHSPRVWVIRFEDQDMPDLVFDNEADARLKFTRANRSWNCYLMASLPLSPPSLPQGGETR